MNRVLTPSRLTSLVVILAVMAITVLGVCSVAFGAPATGGAMGGSGACALDSHSSVGLAGVAAESPTLSALPFAVVPDGIRTAVSWGPGSRNAAVSAELPSPSDPRHGRIRI